MIGYWFALLPLRQFSKTHCPYVVPYPRYQLYAILREKDELSTIYNHIYTDCLESAWFTCFFFDEYCSGALWQFGGRERSETFQKRETKWGRQHITLDAIEASVVEEEVESNADSDCSINSLDRSGHELQHVDHSARFRLQTLLPLHLLMLILVILLTRCYLMK